MPNKLFLFLLMVLVNVGLQGAELNSDGAAWIEEMKTSPKGPFARIRWFCADGEVLPPKSFACAEHGGGSQHGEWNQRTQELRSSGYWIANIFSDLDVSTFLKRDDHVDALSQMLIEQFLIKADDGWILRKARFYRGAFQEEGERAGGRRLLFKLAEDPDWLGHRFLPLRTSVRLLPHGEETKTISTVRQVSAALAEKDPEFVRVRNKIHSRPDASDAELVRRYAERVKDEQTLADLSVLAQAIDIVYAGSGATDALAKLGREAGATGDLARTANQYREQLQASNDPLQRFAITANAMAALRERVAQPNGPRLRVLILATSIAIEDEHFALAAALRGELATASRAMQLQWLGASQQAIYGSGLISARQLAALQRALKRLDQNSVPVAEYKAQLGYLGLVPGWGTQQLRYHFQHSVQKLHEIEPKTELFIQDLLRGSPLFFYSQLLDGLVRDANALAGVRNELFGDDVGVGLRSLNPGLVRGTLRLATGEGEFGQHYQDGIYLLPETTAELPPVAGILTAGEGNPLSHIQLLARNLGIPNVAVDESLLDRVRAAAGKEVVLAVSPGGSVRLTDYDDTLAPIFATQAQEPSVVIEPDLDKLDLAQRDFVTLTDLRAANSGRVVGPKAAKLGELRHQYPEAVADGVTIPFGVFRQLLDQPHPDAGTSVFEWMVAQYDHLESLPDGSAERRAKTEHFREQLQHWIATADPGDAFRERLRARLAEVFGVDGSYGVFVRSDTNVEDLPGFTGAGLNLTVPNVVGVDAIFAAISRVWASPFSERAFGWRQAHMSDPEHVYPAVLLMLSVPSEKSGVMVTRDIDTGDSDWFSVAVNEGVGGAVDGQAAESLRIHKESAEVKLMAQATASIRRHINPRGGVTKVPVTGNDHVLTQAEIEQLAKLARELPQRFPEISDASGNPAPADIEFGFLNGELKLFQIRPFLENKAARGSEFLLGLDQDLQTLDARVDLTVAPN